MKERLETLAESISFRRLELEGKCSGQNERAALQMAIEKSLEIKTIELGFPSARR